MFDILNDFFDSVGLVFTILFSLVIWGLCIVVGCYYHSKNRKNSWDSNILSDLMDVIPSWLMNTVLCACLVGGAFPILNYIADKVQYGDVIGGSRELYIFDERPWYGVGSYQCLIFVMILILGYLVHLYRNK
ncbi:TPA: hypothetical protein QIM46_004033 [Escherichia coli]|nr:hypothetical protein [Escherichia coli]HEO9670023.1 hypothetical protein [Escherichia coli]